MTAKALKGEEREDNNGKKEKKRQDAEEEEEKEGVVVGEEERGGETVIVRAHRVSGWEQAVPRRRRTGSSSSSGGGGDGRGGLSRSSSSSSSSSCSSSSSPSARVERVSSKKREGSPSRRRGLAAEGDVEVKGPAAREKGGDLQRRGRTGKSGGLLQERRAGKRATAIGGEGEDGRRRWRKGSDQGSERERGGTRVDQQLQEKVTSSSGKSERKGARDKQQRRRDSHRPSPRQEDDHKRSWGPEVGLDVVSASRRRSLEPQGVTYDEMPRNFARGPEKQQTANDSGAGGGHAIAAEAEGNGTTATSTGERGGGGGGDYYGASGSGDGALGAEGRPGVVVVASQQGKPREEDKRGDADDQNKSGRIGGGEGREGGGGGESADDDGVVTPRHLPNGGGSGGVSPRAKGGGAECGEWSPRGEGKSKTKRDGGAGGAGDDGAGKSDGPCGAGGGGKPKRKAYSGERAAPAARGTPRKARSSRTQNGASRRASELGPVTYVTHDRTTVVDEEDGHDGRDGAGTGPAGRTGGCGGPSPFPSPFSRRAKRPRPTLQGGSTRAVVWGQSCPACRARSGEPPPGGIWKEADGTSRGGCSGPCRGAEGGAGTGQGPLRIGQYVYLRAPASEDLRRSLVSEGEFAAPRAGGLSGSELAGERIRVLRETGDGGDGSFAAADVVQFNAASGKHRLRFVQDGAVKDVELMKPPDLEADISDDADRGALQDRPEEKGTGGGGGVRWLQRRARRRARDAIQRNAGGLCEGPSGEVRGLVGDEHDPFIQREENWRWALSRWRWNLGERDGYYSDDRVAGGGRRDSGGSSRDGGKRGGGGGGGGSRDTERCGVPQAGDGMFPPIGRVVAVENRRVDTGEKVVEGGADGGGRRNGLKEEEDEGKGRATEVWLKVARLWYPQDTRCGMDPFVHGKAEVFEACRVVRPDGHLDGECTCAPDSRCGSAEAKGTGTAAAHNGKRDSRLPGGAREGGSGSGGAARNRAGAVAASRLSGERPLAACLKIEPVMLWVRACEAHRVASVHPCIDGRLNPCAGKVVNDPYQPQAEFFISHRYCLEADAYFPLESPRSGANSSGGGGGGGGDGRMETIVGALGVPGGGGGREGGLHKLPSPRTAKARLLNRTASDSMLDDLPPKWHPLKKRMSLGQQSPAGGGGGGGGGTDSPVIGWESAIIRSGRADSGSSASGRTTPVDATPWSPRESGHDGRDAQKVYLCHRCRHTFPSSRLQMCSGRGCLNHFCATCAVERSGGLGSSSGGVGGKGRARGMRWPTQPLPPPPLGGLTDPGAGQHDGCETPPQAWTGPCCQGGCGCHECVTGAEEGLLSGWSARNGVASACAAATTTADVSQQRGGLRSLKKARVAARAPAPATAAATPKKMVGWSGWQERPNGVQRNPDPSTGRASANTHVKGRGGGAPACVEGWARDGEGDGQDAVVDTAVEWCRSCSGPGPAGSLARCYYCHGGVHVSGCHRFEEALTRRRLAEFGLGPAGHLSSAPSGEGAVGHGVAVCVDGRWRAGLVLCWSPLLGAHYVRYVDEWESGEGAKSSLDTIPWEGEWVELPDERAREATVGRGGGKCSSSSSSAKRFAATVQASGVRWPLVEISLRLSPPPPPPPPASGSSSSSSAPAAAKPPPESRSATKVLKALLKQNFLAFQAAAAAKSGGAAASHQYRPPGVAVPFETVPSARASGGGGGRESSDGSDVGNGIEHAGEQRRKPWVCRACVEAKVHRLQRRVRSQFLVPWEDPDGPSAVVCAAAAATGREGGGGGSTMASAPPVGADAGSTEIQMTPSKGPPPASVAAGSGTPGAAGSPQPPRQEAAAGAGNDDGKDKPPFIPLVVAGSGNNRGPESKKRPREGSGLASAVAAAAAAASSPEQSGPGGGRCREGGQRDEPAVATAPAAATAAATAAKGEDGGNGNGNGNSRTTPARARGDDNRRLRWLPAGNPGSTRPFAFEAGFMSDLADLHARGGGPTANGAGIGNSRSGTRGGKKRPRPPPAVRAFSHLLGKLETQSALAFALPPEVTDLDRDVAAFFAGGGGGGGRGGGGDEGPFGGEARGAQSVFLVDGTAAVAMAAAAAAGGGREAGSAARVAAVVGASKLQQQKGQGQGQGSSVVAPLGVSGGGSGRRSEDGGGGGGGIGAGAGAASAAAMSIPIPIPAGFSSEKEVDLESSAKIRPVDSSSRLRRRSSSFGGGVRNASRPLRMSSTEAPAAVGEDSSLSGGSGGGGGGDAGGGAARGGGGERAESSVPTTLKDVSRKDRMQRMDQRRMRRQGQTLVDAGLLNLDVLQSRRKKLRFGRSSVHAWGVFADEPIAAGDLVIEYRGEIIGNAVADKREKQYEDMQIGSDYMFRVDEVRRRKSP
ncbi:unnamed protein product [Ectocarpus sp. 12 AP-2014]